MEIRVNRKKAVVFHVEEHTGGRKGVGAGPATGDYGTGASAIAAMCAARTRGNTATCIARNADGAGKAFVLGLVPML